MEWREIKSVLLDDNFFMLEVDGFVATQVDFFSPHSNTDDSVDILCSMYVLDPSQGVSIVRKSMYRRRNPSHVFSPVESVASMCSVYVFMCIW